MKANLGVRMFNWFRKPRGTAAELTELRAEVAEMLRETRTLREETYRFLKKMEQRARADLKPAGADLEDGSASAAPVLFGRRGG